MGVNAKTVPANQALRRCWTECTHAFGLESLPGLAAVWSWVFAVAPASSLELDVQTCPENCPQTQLTSASILPRAGVLEGFWNPKDLPFALAWPLWRAAAAVFLCSTLLWVPDSEWHLLINFPAAFWSTGSVSPEDMVYDDVEVGQTEPRWEGCPLSGLAPGYGDIPLGTNPCPGEPASHQRSWASWDSVLWRQSRCPLCVCLIWQVAFCKTFILCYLVSAKRCEKQRAAPWNTWKFK